MTAVSSVSSCMHWIRGCIIILLLTILDQGSKSLVLAQLKDQPDLSLIPEFYLQTIQRPFHDFRDTVIEELPE